jgi:hypothetical protein
MLSKEVLGLLHKSRLRAVSIKYLPFTWDESQTQLLVKTGFKELLIVRILIAIEVVTLIPIYILGCRAVTQSSDNFADVVMAVLELICISYVVSFQYGFYSCRFEIAVFVNKFLQFEESRCNFSFLIAPPEVELDALSSP